MRHSAVELLCYVRLTVVPLSCLCHAYVCTAHNAHLPVLRTTDHSRRRSMPLSNSAKSILLATLEWLRYGQTKQVLLLVAGGFTLWPPTFASGRCGPIAHCTAC